MFQFPVPMFLYYEGYEHTGCVHSESEFRHRIDRNLTFILLEVIVDKIWTPEATSDREPKGDALYWDWCIILYI